ncbi:MAG: acyl carrier protein [Sandaracinus sp.]|nr:acyl carrier protein [Sandaracinus sp.]MCB9615896.1 acyl carrier protein [Sandaracinus sp.]MCB9624387.1 acyl carrier protein [Sandaracinus sp.]
MNREDIRTALVANMQAVIEGARGVEIGEQQSLVDDFGADSLEIVEVVSRTMKKLKIKVPRTELGKAKNIGELIDLFVKASSGAEATAP